MNVLPDTPVGLVSHALGTAWLRAAQFALLHRWGSRIGRWALESGLRRMPGAPAWALVLGGRTALDHGDTQGARNWYSQLHERHPERSDGAVGLARAAVQDGDWETAVAIWQALVSRTANPRSSWLRGLRAALWHSGERDRAAELLVREWSDTPARRRYLKMMTGQQGAPTLDLRFRHCLIVTYGRSGSTLLQGILNSIEGVLIRGENGNAMYRLFQLERELHGRRKSFPDAFMPTNAWYGISESSDEEILDALRSTARALLIGSRKNDAAISCLGFKEIRYGELGSDLVPYLEFLARLFPDCAFIVNRRDTDETARSGWWPELGLRRAKRQILEAEERLLRHARSRPNWFTISYEEVLQNGERLRALFEFLGAPFDEDRIRAVLAVPHSYKPRQEAVQALAIGSVDATAHQLPAS